MNKNASAIGWVIAVIVLIGLVFYFAMRNPGSTYAPTTGNPTNVTVTTPSNSPQPPANSPQPGLPLLTTRSAIATTDTTAILTGTVVPDGAFTSYWYEYGTSASLGSRTTTQTAGSGYSAIPTPGYITGLTPNATYYFRLVAQNQYGTTNGTQYTFQTTQGNPPPTGSAPATKTLAVTSVSRSTANLNGQVTPNRADTQYWFEYGTTANLGNTTAFSGVGDGTSIVPAVMSISNLLPVTTYYFRINAENQFGTVNGAILNFKTTGPAAPTVPVVSTRTVISVGTTTATFRGTVNPEGAATSYWFEYATAPFSTPITPLATNIQTVPRSPDSTSPAAISSNVSNLSSGATYYVRIVAQNSVGTTRGDSVTFTTR